MIKQKAISVTAFFILAAMLFGAPVFAMGRLSPKVMCIQALTKKNCAPAFGNPWSPNFKFEVAPDQMGRLYFYDAGGVLRTNFKKDASGNLIPMPICENPRKVCSVPGSDKLYPCPCYDPSKTSYDSAGYQACEKDQAIKC